MNESLASFAGRKKLVAVSVIAALILALVSVFGVFAASSTKTNPTPAAGKTNIAKHDIHELDFDRAWLTKFLADHRNSLTSKQRQYVKVYEFALAQASRLVMVGNAAGVPVTGGTSSSGTSSSSSSSSSSSATSTPTATPTTGSSSSSSTTPTAVVPNTGSSSSSSSSSTSVSNNAGASNMSTRLREQNLDGWFRLMRELQEKLTGDSPETTGS